MSFNDYIYWQTVNETGKTPEEIYEYEHPKVVRCKDCIWSEPNEFGDLDCRRHVPRFRVSADGFCNYGEREDE